MKNLKGISLGLAAVMAVALSGCGERLDTQTPVETESKTQIATEAVTEAVTEIQIETQGVVIEVPTEAVTEAVTEPPTEPEPITEDRVLTEEEELAEEAELAAAVTYYANDDLNVRTTPSTESSENIVSSFDQGEEVTVIAKTPHWYKVQKDDFTGYVFKAGLSETSIDPKSEAERAEADAQAQAAYNEDANSEESYEETYNEGGESAQVSASPVESYADSFTIQLSGNANIRAGSSETADVIGVENSGTQLTAIGESGDWYQVDYNGYSGYVNKNLVG